VPVLQGDSRDKAVTPQLLNNLTCDVVDSVAFIPAHIETHDDPERIMTTAALPSISACQCRTCCRVSESNTAHYWFIVTFRD
jgi:hypothetical protein